MPGRVAYRSAGTMPDFCYLYFSTNGKLYKNTEDMITRCVSGLRNQMHQDIGDIVYNRQTNEIIAVTPCSFEARTIDEIHERLRGYFENARRNDKIRNIYLVVLPENKTIANKIYGIMKKLGDIDFGFHTVCITQRTLTIDNNAGDIRANVGLKFNLKTGGTNHLVSSKSTQRGLPFIVEGDTMVVGYDVSHPTGVGFSKEPGKESAGEGKKPEDGKTPPPSFVGLVASVDRYLSNWPAVAWTNKSRVEMLDREKLRSSLRSRLELWKINNSNKLPGHIIVYRDGVSEGQYKAVLDVEVEAIREVCKEYGGETPIKLLFIVTAKRHNTRFYLKPKNRGLPVSNPKNGLVVDSKY